MTWREGWFSVDRKGTSRIVFLLGQYAIKFPTVSSWTLFLQGLIGNCKERTWGEFGKVAKEPLLPPIVWVCPGGWVSIQRRVRPVRHRGLFYIELYHAMSKSKIHRDFWLYDVKPENFGWYQGKLVKIDIS